MPHTNGADRIHPGQNLNVESFHTPGGNEQPDGFVCSIIVDNFNVTQFVCLL